MYVGRYVIEHGLKIRNLHSRKSYQMGRISLTNKTEKPFSLQTTKRTGRTGGTRIYYKIFKNIPKKFDPFRTGLIQFGQF